MVALLQQVLYCLLCGHWARFYWHAGEGGCGSDGTVGQFDAKGGLTEFQVFKAFTRGLAYPADPFLYIGSLRGYWQNDVGFTGRDGQHTATGTADQDGRMWLLHGPGKRAQCGGCIVLAGEIDGFGGKELFDDGQPFRKARDACARLVKWYAELLVLVGPVARAQSKFYTTVGE